MFHGENDIIEKGKKSILGSATHDYKRGCTDLIHHMSYLRIGARGIEHFPIVATSESE